MPTVSKTLKIAAAGGVAAVVAGLGASAAMADSTPSPSGTTTTAPSQEGPGRAGPGGGPGGRHGGPGGLDAAALAKQLGLTEAKVTAALEKVRATDQPPTPPAEGTRPTPPTEAQRQAREKAHVAALAKALGVGEAKVQAALDGVRAQREAGRRTDLSTRLDAAVKAGKLSAADQASVLKAFDAGVLGGGPRP
ncbi:hypothetical protein SAMN04489867_3726 [Pedococcus dokdonensis]|nr:hypothetical protein [Pedococcus dokdonensis]SDP74648.1 hypothetical protein SAMN04489867_3726 [Pedococcus dokdonensis]